LYLAPFFNRHVAKGLNLKRSLILGVAWHILRAITLKLGLAAPASYEDPFPEDDRLDFAFYLQLTPEMAEDINTYEHVCFVDAHTGNIPEPVRLISVESEFQASPFTHHLTPQSLLSICETLYGNKPDAALLSVRGYHFGLSQQLSEETAQLVPQAVRSIWDWLVSRDLLQ
jgi:Ni,Fe-hydrogenase maturation factor